METSLQLLRVSIGTNHEAWDGTNEGTPLILVFHEPKTGAAIRSLGRGQVPSQLRIVHGCQFTTSTKNIYLVPMQGQGYRIRDGAAVYFITFAVVEWVDVFSRRMYADIVLDSLRYCCKSKGLKLFAWCIMSNHLHLIVESADAG